MDDIISKQYASSLEEDAHWLTEYAQGKKDCQRLIEITTTMYRAAWALGKMPSAQPEYYDYSDIDDVWEFYAEEQDIDLTDGAKQLKDAMWVGYRKGKQDAQPERLELSEEDMRLFKKLRSFHAGSYANLLDRIMAKASAQPEPKCADGCLYGWGSDECKKCTYRDYLSAQPDRSLWFRIGEICVDESKGFISADRAVEKIRELLREAERRTDG